MKTLLDLRSWASAAPKGASIAVDGLAELLDELDEVTEAPPARPEGTETLPWSVLLWTVDAETRIGRNELLEAVGRPVSWLYRHTGQKSSDRIPHRRMDGHLVFVVGEVRRWLREREEIVEAGPVDGPRPRSMTATQ
ncbi:MAG: hypothetical protein ABL963_06850 [Longimicrobiales bacterium]